MNKLFLSLTIVSTCLISNITWANPSLGNSAIEKHNKNAQALKSATSTQTSTNKIRLEDERNSSLGGAAIDKHKKRVESESSLRSTNASNSKTTMQEDVNNNESLGGSAIKKHEKVVNDNLK